MAKPKVKTTKKVNRSKWWSPLRVLELLVLVGSVAAVAVKMLRGKKIK